MALTESERAARYGWWQQALVDLAAGFVPELPSKDAQAGFYRSRKDEPVEIRPDEDGDLWGRVGTGRWVCSIEDGWEGWCERVFSSACRHPVSREAFETRMSSGSWPDEVALPPRDHNGPPEVIAAETIKELGTEFDQWLAGIGGKVETREHADKVANFASRIEEEGKAAEKARVAEKEPHLEAGRAVDAKWKPVVTEAAAAKKRIAGHLTAFLAADKARKLREAAEAAEQGKQVDTRNAVSAKAGTRGRGVILRTYREFRCHDLAKLMAHYVGDKRFLDHPDAIAAASKLALKDLEAGHEVPGASIETVQRAA